MHNIYFDQNLAEQYKSPSQKIRVLTENWVDEEIFCPSCGHNISKFGSNRPVADFYCPYCNEEYELKSKKDGVGNKIVNGAYATMIKRLEGSNNPNFFLLNYAPNNLAVLNFFVIPKYFFVPEIIEKRAPLSKRARRAGWIGCNIILQNIPLSGKIFYIKNKLWNSKKDILGKWQKTLFLQNENDLNAKGWILDIMQCIDKLNTKEFTLEDVYKFESFLQLKHPNNKHIKDKIRQQLQLLRDKGYLQFIGRGRYKLN